MNLWALLLLASIGTFSVLGAWKNWDWFMNNRRARLVISLLGRTGARWFYALIGLFFLISAVALFMETSALR